MTKPPFELTDNAKKHIKSLMAKNDLPQGYGLRVPMDGGGCGGMSYIIGFDVQSETDRIFQDDDIMIYMLPAHGMYLAGLKIDYVERKDEAGFTFSNPTTA